AVVQDGGEREAGDEAPRRDERSRRAPPGGRDEDGDHHAEAGGGERRQRRREREPVDVRAGDRGDHWDPIPRNCERSDWVTSWGAAGVDVAAAAPVVWSVIAAGHAERKSSTPTSG